MAGIKKTNKQTNSKAQYGSTTQWCVLRTVNLIVAQSIIALHVGVVAKVTHVQNILPLHFEQE